MVGRGPPWDHCEGGQGPRSGHVSQVFTASQGSLASGGAACWGARKSILALPVSWQRLPEPPLRPSEHPQKGCPGRGPDR